MDEILKTVDTVGELISLGTVITIEGVLVVFAILILIMLVIYAMSLFSKEKKPKKKVESAPVAQAVESPSVTEETVDEGELIAVLTAAIAACMGTSSSSVNIRSYKKVSSAWGNAAKREVLDNRF